MLAFAYWILLFPIGFSVAADEYCEPIDFTIRSMAKVPESAVDFQLLNENERSVPGMTEKLMAQSSLYGHSELGFRYLARLLGYQGEFASPEITEFTILSRALKDVEYKGTDILWQKYVQRPELTFKPFYLSESPKTEPGEPELLFDRPLQRVRFEQCLHVAYLKTRCEAKIGQVIHPGAWVNFRQVRVRGSEPGKNKLVFNCSVSYNNPREMWIRVNNALGRGEIKNRDELYIQGEGLHRKGNEKGLEKSNSAN